MFKASTAMAALLALATGLSGCTTAGQNAAGGAAMGGVFGATAGALVGRSPTAILIGAGIGATTGAIVAANNTRPAGYCTFRDRNTGQLYYARCPR